MSHIHWVVWGPGTPNDRDFFSLLQLIKRKLGGEEGRCRCYERRRDKAWGNWSLSIHTLHLNCQSRRRGVCVFICSRIEKGENIMLFIITEKSRATERKWDGVGVMKDKERKLEDVKTPSHTLLNIIHTIWIHRSRRSRRRHQPCGGRVVETEESICMCERGAWGRGVGGKGGRGHAGTISVVRYT